MKVAMVTPSRKSEKAISGYSEELVKAAKINKIDIDFVTYERGLPISFFKLFPKFKSYDIVHIQHEYNLLGYYGLPYFLIYLYFILPRNYKVITTMHNILPLNEKFHSNFIKTIFRKLLYIFQNRVINYGSDLIFVHSNFFVPTLVNWYNVPKRKIVVLPQGIIEGVKITEKNKAKKSLKIKSNVYLIIGNLQYGKGTDIIVGQADKIGKTLLIASNPDPVNDEKKKRLSGIIENLMREVKHQNLSEYVRFDISSLNDKMPKWWLYFSAADFVMLPYRGGIGSGIFTHAIATKKPVISSSIPFFTDIEKNYGCIKTAENESNYSRLVHECIKSKNYKKMVKECERYMKENSWRAVTKRYKDIYLSLLK